MLCSKHPEGGQVEAEVETSALVNALTPAPEQGTRRRWEGRWSPDGEGAIKAGPMRDLYY
jgi:hypothetical protein